MWELLILKGKAITSVNPIKWTGILNLTAQYGTTAEHQTIMIIATCDAKQTNGYILYN